MYALDMISMGPDACKQMHTSCVSLFFLNPVEKQLTRGNNGRFNI